MARRPLGYEFLREHFDLSAFPSGAQEFINGPHHELVVPE